MSVPVDIVTDLPFGGEGEANFKYQFQCCICLEIPLDIPYVHTIRSNGEICGKLYCKPCIMNTQLLNYCVICRERFMTNTRQQIDFRMQMIYNTLNCKCNFCDQTISLSDWRNHSSYLCNSSKVQCLVEGCNVQVIRSQMHVHIMASHNANDLMDIVWKSKAKIASLEAQNRQPNLPPKECDASQQEDDALDGGLGMFGGSDY